MQQYPLWATPERRAILAEVFAQSLPSLVPQFYRNLGKVILDGMSMGEFLDMLTRDIGHDFIEYWKEDDRVTREYLWKREQRRMHADRRRLGKRGIIQQGKRPMDSIRREQLHADRPVFEVLGIGVSAFSQHRVAKVRITELHKIVWVDISGVDIPRRKLRKLARRKGKLPDELYQLIKKGVRRYL